MIRFTLADLQHRLADIRRALRSAAPVVLCLDALLVARICPPGRIPVGWSTWPLSYLATHRRDAHSHLLRGEPLALTYHGSTLLVLLPLPATTL